MGGCCLCIQLTRGGNFITTPSSLNKSDKNVGNEGCIGKSETSSENSPRKVFQNAYIGYHLKVDHWTGFEVAELNSIRHRNVANFQTSWKHVGLF